MRPIDSISTDIAFDEGTGAIWIAATDGLERVNTDAVAAGEVSVETQLTLVDGTALSAA